jgi:lipooligosaccharide transport system permease protein
MIWKSNLLGAVIQPLMYLLGVGVGVGALVDEGAGNVELLGGSSYLAFYAAAIVATASMFVGAQEALWPTMDGFSWSNAYRAATSTPLTPRDVVTGLMIHYAIRVAISASGVALVLTLFDETRGVGLVAAIPAGVLTGLSFSMPFAAWTATRTSDTSFPAIMRFGIIPMFLFGGAFYPVEQLPDWLEPVTWATPLWHGVELCRGAILGGLGAGRVVLHVGSLLAFVTAGYIASAITFERRLRV